MGTWISSLGIMDLDITLCMKGSCTFLDGLVELEENKILKPGKLDWFSNYFSLSLTIHKVTAFLLTLVKWDLFRIQSSLRF